MLFLNFFKAFDLLKFSILETILVTCLLRFLHINAWFLCLMENTNLLMVFYSIPLCFGVPTNWLILWVCNMSMLEYDVLGFVI